MKQLIFLLLFVGTTVADEPKGAQTHKLYDNCKTALKMIDGEDVSISEARSGGFCMGYLRGFADSREGQIRGEEVLNFKRNVSAEALTKSFVNYVNAHPAEMAAPDLPFVLGKAWAVDGLVTIKPLKQ